MTEINTGSSTSQSEQYVRFNSPFWRQYPDAANYVIAQAELDAISSLNDRVSASEVSDLYYPLSRLIKTYYRNRIRLLDEQASFFADGGSRNFLTQSTPYIVAIAGSVAVGKSTSARLLQTLLERGDDGLRVALVPTDGFLYPNAVLEQMGLMQRKGFPESYDVSVLIKFLQELKSGKPKSGKLLALAPVYSHLTYDVVSGERMRVEDVDIVIIEGLNVLQPSRGNRLPRNDMLVSDFFDYSIYVHAEPELLQEWFLERFFELRRTWFTQENSYFEALTRMSDVEAKAYALDAWNNINLPNLTENILPTKSRASIILNKGDNHAVTSVELRRL